MTLISRSPEWMALAAHRDAQAEVTLRDLFAADPTRGTTYAVERPASTSTTPSSA